MEIEKTESGTPIIRYDNIQREWEVPEYGDEEHIDLIVEHIEKYLGNIDMVYHELISDKIHMDVYHVKPTKENPFHTLITQGMSNLPMNPMKGAEEYKYAELMIYLPQDWKISQEDFKDERWYWPIRCLKFLAKFPHLYNTWLGFGHTIPNGDPPVSFCDETKLNTIMLLPPIKTSKEFWELKINEEKIIRFYCLVPLYNEEVIYKLNHGIDALLDKFDEYNIDMVVDLKRKNTCKKNFFFWKR